jgi:VanZ family protein
VRAIALSAAANNAVVTLHRLLTGTPLASLGKAALIGCAVTLAVLAWAPAQAMTRTPLGGHAEHLIAYVGTALVFGLTSRTTSQLAAQCLLLMGYAAVLESGQLYAPGREACLNDFGFSASGVILGGVAVWVARRCWTRGGNRQDR